MASERRREYADEMMELSYRHHRFPPIVIQQAVRLYLASRSATETSRICSTAASTAWVSSARVPPRRTSVREAVKTPGWRA